MEQEMGSPSASPIAIRPKIPLKIKFCQMCNVVDGGMNGFAVCPKCAEKSEIAYNQLVGTIIEDNDKILLCRLITGPSCRLWDIPAGFVNEAGSSPKTALSKCREKAKANVELVATYAVMETPITGQCFVCYLGRLKTEGYGAGPKCIDCKFFNLDEIPFGKLAFSTTAVILKMYIQDRKNGRLKYHTGSIHRWPEYEPCDIFAYSFEETKSDNLLVYDSPLSAERQR